MEYRIVTKEPTIDLLGLTQEEFMIIESAVGRISVNQLDLNVSYDRLKALWEKLYAMRTEADTDIRNL